MALLKRREALEAAAYIYEQRIRGKRDKYIQEQLGLDADQYAEACKFLLENRSEQLREMPREHVYVEYVIDQKKNIKDLDSLIKNLDANSQYNALIGAIRLRSDIQNKIVDRAQEFGLVKKEAEKRELIGGIALFDLAADDLRKKIVSHTKGLADVMRDYGEKDFLRLPSPELHYGESAFETTGEEAADSADEDDEAELEKPSGRAKAKEAAKAAILSAMKKAKAR